MRPKCLYKDHYLVAMSSETEDGRFQSRVAIMVISDTRTHSQRFLDFEVFDLRHTADSFAIEAAKDWVDQKSIEDTGRSHTNFASF